MLHALSGFFRTRHRYAEVFLIGGLTAASFMVLYLVLDGAFMFYGDFNVQQIPFYIEANRAVRSGSLLWNATTDLGVNFIGSYSFYLLGSPFFWLTTLLPMEWVGYSLGYLYILKFACASLTAYLYLERFVKNKDYALIGALLYAFSGYGIYNIFFNHFHEALVFFPLLLLGMELHITEGRRGVFAFAVFINAFVNYYFFFGEVIFCIIYFLIRAASPGWTLTVKRFLTLLLEAVLGLGLSCVMLLPALVSAAGISRSTNFIDGWKGLFYGEEQRYGLIVESFFFPPDIPARPNFFPDSDSKWASTAGWLPLFSMSGVIAFLQSKKKHWLKRVLWTSIFFAFIPFLNAAFSFFNYGYYSRWFYMPILLMALATTVSLEDEEVDWGRGFRWTAFITLFITVTIAFFPKKVAEENGDITWKIGKLANYADRFWIYVAIALISLGVMLLLFYGIRRTSPHFTVTALISTVLIVAIYANVFIMIGRAHSYDREWIRDTLIDQPSGITLPDTEEELGYDYRVDVVPDSMDNIGLYWGMSSICAFHSIVPGSVFDYYDAVGVSRSVGSRPEWTHQALRSFLSVKWLIDPDNDSAETVNGYSGWTYVTETEGYGIYRNDNYIPMGFTYDNFVTTEGFETLSKTQKEKILLMAMVLNEAQAEKYGHLMELIPLTEEDAADDGSAEGDNGFADQIDGPEVAPVPGVPSLTTTALSEACKERAASSCKTFRYTTTGFEATIDLDKDNLVFFSVPYDDGSVSLGGNRISLGGWTATVNGKPVSVERVNVGFMAVEVPAGDDNVITFTYMTPGLVLGAWITGGSAVVLVGYLITAAILKRRRKKMGVAVSVEEMPLTTADPCLFLLKEGEPVDDLELAMEETWDDKPVETPAVERGPDPVDEKDPTP